MRILASIFPTKHWLAPLLLAGSLIESCTAREAHTKQNEEVPVTVIGVHHLGEDYRIQRFHINKSVGDSVGKGGGGGGMVCCITLPRRWQPKLLVDVRWEVDRLVKSTKLGLPDTAVIEGLYRAQVPVEQYVEPGDFYVHFFQNGSVRIVVTTINSDNEAHPIRPNDALAHLTAVKGTAVSALFTPEEVIERKKAASTDRRKYGDWR